MFLATKILQVSCGVIEGRKKRERWQSNDRTKEVSKSVETYVVWEKNTKISSGVIEGKKGTKTIERPNRLRGAAAGGSFPQAQKFSRDPRYSSNTGSVVADEPEGGRERIQEMS